MNKKRFLRNWLGQARALLPALILVTLAAMYAPAQVFAERSIAPQDGRVVQVVLEQHPKISQYADIDSSARGFGKNACGPVAAAAAVGGDNWAPLVSRIAIAAGENYGRNTGIQPSKYVHALQ